MQFISLICLLVWGFRLWC